MNRNCQLPESVEMHFDAANTGDSAAFLSAFHDDATVIDAGKEYHGRNEIEAWSDEIYFKDNLRLKITNAVQNTKEIVVTAIADGDYDKSGLPDPLYLDFHFVIKEAKVCLLRIVLSSNSRAVPLPQPIAAYYHASDVYDSELLAACFAQDAILYDEDMEFRGPAEISRHILKANKEANVRMDIMNLVEQSRETIVTAMLTGNFEGSPLPLDFHFTFDNGKIKSLNIMLSEE
ncbi:snoaL-like domain protein [Oxobacter pfennigii]|uniref:SnoaL-like domain protein n=1 Tax=Oxobacter pfennigii TaxID=36849 RepID=A0A0P8YX69_9CLOT|nr:nuclear transport factor 2 family protein [Oxobacter pfennigii]KPU44316.1 snoaL-like domain protein [Oxobacter pfennigii]